MRTGYIIVNKKRITYKDDDKTITFSDGKVIGPKTSLMDVADSYKQATVPIIKPILSDYKFTWPTSKLKIMATRVTSGADGSFLDFPNNGNIKRNLTGNTVFTLVSDKRIQLQNDVILPVGTNTINFTDFPDGSPVKAFFDAVVQLTQSVLSFGASTTSQNVVNWTSVLNATNYLVRRSVNSDMSGAVTIYNGSLLTVVDSGLASSTTYYYQVTASAVGYTNSVSAVANKTTNASAGTYTLALNVTGVESGDLPIVYPAPFNSSGVATFASGVILSDFAFGIDGYTIDPVAIAEIVMDSNKVIPFTASKNIVAVNAPHFTASDGSFSSSGAGQLTTTSANVRAVVNKIADGADPSTLPILSIEASYDPSWNGRNPAIGLAAENFGVTRNDMEGWIQFETGNTPYGAPSQQSLGYLIPQVTTSKMKVEAVPDAVYWRFNFLTSTDSGATFVQRQSLLSTIPKTTPLFGNLFLDATGIVMNGVKVITA